MNFRVGKLWERNAVFAIKNARSRRMQASFDVEEGGSTA
jgi:hypothetical protein